MNWIKQGLIYCSTGKHGFDATHCHKPTPLILDDKTVRVYFGARDVNNKTRTTFVDLDIDNLKNIKYIHDKPVVDLGKLGAFDDSGANVSSVIRNGNMVYLYYIGVNTSTTVHMRNAIGLAISHDNGFTFERAYEGAIIDRSKDEPYYIGAVDVIKYLDKWYVYYTCGSEWKIINGKPEIFYHVKFGESLDGINWLRNNILAIPPVNEFEATARPCVLYEDGIFKMWYSKRSLYNFRNDVNSSYRAGYAESIDGMIWNRKDEELSLEVSNEGWDSEMIAYPYVIKIKDKYIMFYNGNSFGKTGFGYAILDN
jgi:hypothetical protein